MRSVLRILFTALLAVAGAVSVTTVRAQTAAHFDIPAQPLVDALKTVASQTGTNVLFDLKVVEGLRTTGLKGRLTPEEAVARLLEGTGVRHRVVNAHTIVLDRATATTSALGLDHPESERSEWGIRLADGETPAQDSPANEPQSSASDDASRLQEIVVTAQKREERLQDVPMTIVAISGSDLERRGIDDFQELSYAVPELAVFSNGTGGNQLFLRGIGGVGGTEPLVGVYLDEIGVSGQTYYPLDLRSLDLQRVEVLYGPQGTLYGQGSAGGTVRFITNKPAFDKVHLRSMLDLSVTEDGSPSEKVTGIANVPLVPDVFALRVAAAYENIGGWVDAPQANKQDINSGRLYNVRVIGQWNATSAVTVTPMVAIYRNHSDSTGNGENDDGDKILPPFAPGTIPETQNDYDLYGLTVSADLGRAELSSATGYYTTSGDGGFTNAFGAFHRSFETHGSSKVFNQEVRLSSNGAGRLSWTIGAFYSDVKYDSLTILTAGPSVKFSFSNFEEGSSWSLFENMSYKFSNRLEVGGGARYFKQEKTDGVENPHFHSFDPRLYLSYAFTDGVKTFISAAKGFRGGGFNAIDPSFPPQFAPEKVHSYEIGVKFSALEFAARGEVSAFHSRYDDMQVDTLSPVSGLGYTGNVGEARIHGIDGSLQFDLSERTTVGAVATWLDTEVVDVAPGSGVAEGDRLNYIPKYSYGLFAQQKFAWSASVPGLIRIDYNERGSSMFTSRGARRIDESGVTNMLNARLEATWGHFLFDVYGENLLNDRDRIFPNIVDFAARPRPRTFGIRFGANF